MNDPHTTKEGQQELEFAISRGSVPCIPRRAESPPLPAVWLELLRRTATSNLVMSVVFLAVTHLAVPLVHFVTAMMVGGIITVTVQQSTGGPTQFTPNHLFFISTTGSDANNGLTPATSWASPNHAVSCKDVILAAAGDYSATMNTGTWGTVSNCPSADGVYFAILLCAGADLEACHTSGSLWDIPKNNWSVQGWKITNPASPGSFGGTNRGFNFNGCGGPVAFFAAVNNVLYSVSSAVHTDDCGIQPPASAGADYVAAVGIIAVQASMNTANCEAAFDHVGPFPHDTNAGTHAYFYTNYTWNDNSNGCNGTTGGNFDSEAFMFDSWDAHAGYSVTGVIANSIAWNAQRYCVQVINQGNFPTITPTMKFYNNTCFHNLVNTTTDNADGEFNTSLGLPWVMQFFNNIAVSTPATSAGGQPIYAFVNGGGLNSGSQLDIGGKQNILKGSATGCAGTCDAGNNVAMFNGNTVPAGIYVNPGFNNTTDLLNNQSSNTPNCSGFVNTTLCMGWNANTRVLTNPSVIYDLQPDPNCGSVANQCVGKGFQLPSTTCVSGGDVFTDYPDWLKSVVYLRASGFTLGAAIAQYHDLATTKCGL